MPIKINCPKCGRVLGDTKQTVDCHINCNGCKSTVHIQMMVAKAVDYLPSECDPYREHNKGKMREKYDKSKR